MLNRLGCNRKKYFFVLTKYSSKENGKTKENGNSLDISCINQSIYSR